MASKHRPVWGRLLSGILLPLTFLAACSDLLGTGGTGTPNLRFMEPEAGSTGVSVLASIRLRFSTELDETTVGEAVSLRQGDRVVRTRIFLKDHKIVILEPTDPLDFGTLYRVAVDPTLRSRSGDYLPEREEKGFSTEGIPFPLPDPERLYATLAALAHDTMNGRGSGTADEHRAALYLAGRFAEYGLALVLPAGLQPFQAISRKQELLSSQNVIALVPGLGTLAGEWILVGAHYDHLGLRLQADGTLAINNGADDNASGTALLLEMARIYRAQVAAGGVPTPNRRSVIFVGFGAEEEGLLGSCHYALVEPVQPIEATRAMMNLDMVGRLRNRVLQIRGLESSGAWANMVVNANDSDLVLYDPPTCKACTDFACFRDRGVPHIGFFTGTHEQYHTPADDVELINFPGLAEVGNLALGVLSRLAVMPNGPPPREPSGGAGS